MKFGYYDFATLNDCSRRMSSMLKLIGTRVLDTCIHYVHGTGEIFDCFTKTKIRFNRINLAEILLDIKGYFNLISLYHSYQMA
jgi:hypothetical protein